MSKMSREEKLFRNENLVLDHYKDKVARNLSPEESREGLKDLTRKYKNLLEQARFLTWISGRLERKLQRTNRELHANNAELQQTLTELTKAEASRSAYAIIYSIAIALFVLEEFFVEPVITMFGDSPGLGVLIKLFIVVLLKVAETVIEKKVTKKRRAAVVSMGPG